MSGWATLGAALGGANNGARQQMLFNQGAEQGARMENLLGEARRRRDQNLAFQSITPQSIQSAMSTADPITGQPYAPEAAQAMQGNLVSALLHAGVDPRQFSGYQKDRQAIGWGDDAMRVATSANPDDNLLNRMQIVRAGKPVELTKVEGNAVLNPYATPDSQTVKMTDLGQAMAGAQGALAGKYTADAGAAHALAGERNAHAGLFNVQAAAGGFNPNTGGGAALPVKAADPNGAHGDAYLGSIDPSQATMVKALSEGRMAFPTGTALKSPYWQQMLQDVAQYDPSFDAVNYNARAGTRKAFTSGKEAQTINALNTVAEHLGLVSDDAAALNNTRFQLWNRIKNSAAEATGDPSISRFNTARKAAADEVAKVWRASGGSMADIEENMKNLDAAQSPEQLNAAIGTLTQLIHGKISALQDQYKTGMGTTADPNRLVSPQAQAAFDKTLARDGVDRTAFDRDAGAPGHAAVPAAPQPSGYHVGQVVTVGGKQYRVTGGDPADPDLEAL